MNMADAMRALVCARSCGWYSLLPSGWQFYRPARAEPAEPYCLAGRFAASPPIPNSMVPACSYGLIIFELSPTWALHFGLSPTRTGGHVGSLHKRKLHEAASLPQVL